MSILEFYRDNEPNQEGLFLSDIIKFNDEQLEDNHCYIQWLFPLKEASSCVPGSPVLTEEDIEVFTSHPMTTEEMGENLKLRGKFIDAFYLMIHFYGLRLEISKDEMPKLTNLFIAIDPNTFDSKSKKWITPKNHNFLRITRILRSLILLGHESSANMFYKCLCEIYEDHKDIIGSTTKQFWDESMEI